MNTVYDFKDPTDPRIVYIRPAAREELPNDMPAELQGDGDIYSVHSPDGERLAFVKGRQLAFALARQNDFSPVTVH